MSDRPSLRARYKKVRKKLLSFTPFVKRRRHETIVARILRDLRDEIEQERNSKLAIAALFVDRPSLAGDADMVMRVPIANSATDELCLFVTHSPSVDLKPHVLDHIQALLASDVSVLLIVNTDLDRSSLNIPPALAERLYGCIVRKNVGFDFAGWAHAYSFVERALIRKRLYLINDSILGPLDTMAYEKLLGRIRECGADFIGLTRNDDPLVHLQSFYLVFNNHLVHSTVLDKFMRGIVNMPDKQSVIDSYEVGLTPFLERAGFTTEAMFPVSMHPALGRGNLTFYQWKELLDDGFPFVKSAVLSHLQFADEARRIVPSRYLSVTRPSPAQMAQDLSL
jgi:Rhamnan synthesis protein F